MNPREKRLALGVGALVGLFLVVYGGRAVFMKPLREIDKKKAALRLKLEKVKSERRAYFAAEDIVKRCAQRAFSDQVGEASARSGEMLTKTILRSGLREVDFSRMPVGPRKLRGASEIGWSVQGQGALGDVVNLLFLLQNSPYLHRIENVSVSAGDASGNVRVGFRFLTLVIEPSPPFDPVELPPSLPLDSPERRRFDWIVSRDLLRPHVPQAAETAELPVASSPEAGPAALKVVSLSQWAGQPEVHVHDVSSNRTTRYQLGDPLAEGVIEMVDYRALPMPGNAGLKSFSRVILRIGSEYWAVERGQTLAEKRRLTPEELPPRQ